MRLYKYRGELVIRASCKASRFVSGGQEHSPKTQPIHIVKLQLTL